MEHFTGALAELSRYGEKSGGNFVFWGDYAFTFSGLLNRKCLSLHEAEFHVSGIRTEAPMRRKRVEFDAQVTVKKPTEVEFTTKDGKQVDFTAKKPTKEEVHVDFLAKPKKKA